MRCARPLCVARSIVKVLLTANGGEPIPPAFPIISLLVFRFSISLFIFFLLFLYNIITTIKYNIYSN